MLLRAGIALRAVCNIRLTACSHHVASFGRIALVRRRGRRWGWSMLLYTGVARGAVGDVRLAAVGAHVTTFGRVAFVRRRGCRRCRRCRRRWRRCWNRSRRGTIIGA